MKTVINNRDNRIAIYVFYDENGIVDEYVVYMLESLKSVARTRIVVVNGTVLPDGLVLLKSNSENVIVRRNVGYDWGAYKEALLQIEPEKLSEYDNLVLLNNSFIGPFFPWSNYFNKMDFQNVDFWGITRHPTTNLYIEHLQSYFLVFKKKVFLSKGFRDVFEKMPYATSFQEAVNTESQFTKRMCDEGFSFSSLMDIYGDFDEEKLTGGEYARHPLLLVKKTRLPILKITAISPFYNYEELLGLIQWLKDNSDYDSDSIIRLINRLDEVGRIAPLGFKEIRDFFNAHNRVFLYGNGVFGHSMDRYTAVTGLKHSGIVTTKKTEGTIAWDDVSLSENDGVIICCSRKKDIEEIYESVKQKTSEINILKPHADSRGAHWGEHNK